MAFELGGQVDGVFQRELGAAADGEVGGVRGVAHEYDGDAAAGDVLGMHPGLADHAGETDPDGRSAQVRGVADEAVAVEVRSEELFAEGDGVFLAHLVDAVRLPHVLRRLHDEGGGVGVELVGVRLEPAMFGLDEGEGEGVEGLLRAQPDEAALARVDVGLEGAGVACAHAAVEAVAGDHKVGGVLRGQGLVVGDVGLEHQVHAERLAARLQHVEQPLAPDAAEAVAAAAHAAALVEDFDVVPVVEGVADLLRRLRIGRAQVAQGLVGQHHAPAEGVERAVALDDGDLQRGLAPLHQQREVQAGRATTDAQDALQGRFHV